MSRRSRRRGLAGRLVGAAIDDATLPWETGDTMVAPRRAFLLSYGGEFR